MRLGRAEDFAIVMDRMKKDKPAIMARHSRLLDERYDLADRAADGGKMARGKPVQGGTRVKLPDGLSWAQLAAMSPDQLRERDAWPKGFFPLPHPNHPEGGMVFPKFHIDEVKKQTARDLTRFDLDYDLPEHMLPKFPAPISLTTRPDLGDVSQGQLVTTENFFALFNGILNPKQLEGLRLLVTPFPQQQSDGRPTLGAAEYGRVMFSPLLHRQSHAQPAGRALLQAADDQRPHGNRRWPDQDVPPAGCELKDSPPYLHDGRLLTLEDTVEFFNLVLEVKLDEKEKHDLVAFLRCL